MNGLVDAVRSNNIDVVTRILRRPREDLGQPEVLAGLQAAVQCRNAEMVRSLAVHHTMTEQGISISSMSTAQL